MSSFSWIDVKEQTLQLRIMTAIFLGSFGSFFSCSSNLKDGVLGKNEKKKKHDYEDQLPKIFWIFFSF